MSPKTSPRVLRGGSFGGSEEKVRGANRNFYAPEKRAANIGFRCVKNLSE